MPLLTELRDRQTALSTMKAIFRACIVSSALFLIGCKHTTTTPPTMEEPYKKPASFDVTGSRTFGKIERLDPRLDELIGRDAKLEKLAQGFDWSEGPIWMKSEKALLFSDVPQNVVYRWKEG